jgi:hypothetical protein
MESAFQVKEASVVITVELGAGAVARVKEEDEVTKGAVIGEKLPDRAEYDLVKILKVKEEKAEELLLKQVGDEVKPGDLLAKRKGWLKSKKIKSQVVGKVVAWEEGKLVVEIDGTGHEIFSVVTGKVVGVEKDSVKVEISGEEVDGSWGWGEQVWGKLWMLGFLDTGELSIESVRGDLKDLVVVMGVPLHKGIWHKLCTLGIKGLICPGVPDDFEDWVAGDDDEDLAGKQTQVVVVVGEEQKSLGAEEQKSQEGEDENSGKGEEKSEDTPSAKQNEGESTSEVSDAEESTPGESPSTSLRTGKPTPGVKVALDPNLWEWFNKRVGKVAVLNGGEKKVFVSKE